MTQYVQLSADTTSVITWFASPQPTTSDKPGYAAITDNDPRYLAWQAQRAANQSYTAAMIAGVAISSTGTPAINGTYAIDQASQGKLTSEQVYIATKGSFTNGLASRSWPDANGTFHTFTSVTLFTNMAVAIAQYVDALATALAVVQAGGTWTAPAQPAAIP